MRCARVVSIFFILFRRKDLRSAARDHQRVDCVALRDMTRRDPAAPQHFVIRMRGYNQYVHAGTPSGVQNTSLKSKLKRIDGG